METATNRQERHRRTGSAIVIQLFLMLTIVGSFGTIDSYAEDLKSLSAHFAEQSFALLNSVSNQGGDHPNPLLGPVASFVGDADSVRRSLAINDLRTATPQIVTLQADTAAIDQALKQHANAIAARQWNELKRQVEQLAREIPSCGGACAAPAAAVSDSMPTKDRSTNSYAPQIVINSRESTGGTVRLKGYFEGTALKSAGVFEGPNRLKAFKVDGIPGRQRVEFDLRLEDPSAATTLRVIDADGRTAEAYALAPDVRSSAAAEISPEETAPIVPTDNSVTAGGDSSIAEIPSHGPLMPSPSKRHTLASKLGDVRIDIAAVTETGAMPPTYEIAGQISGRGITRAGIYLDGRLVRPIPITPSASLTNFHQRIVAKGGVATIRAYAIGDQFVEQSVDLSDATVASAPSETANSSFIATTPIPPTGIAVQITGVRPVTANLYTVNGIISGPDIASAGLYQNGMLAQNINLGSGLASALGGLLNGGSRSISFKIRFNPYVGPATIRAFDSTGTYTEQPVAPAPLAPHIGIPPYGGVSPNAPGSGAGTFPYRGGVGAGAYPSGLGAPPL
jgi:hypothetical protein